MNLYIVRHGETEENVNNIIQGHQAGTLTALGHEQARLLAQRLRELRFDAIYASDLGRVVDTARYILQYQTAPIEYDPLLRERGAGIYETHPRQRLWEAEMGSGLPLADFRPEGGESFRDLQDRVERFIDFLRQRHTDETILLVSHGGWNRQFLGVARHIGLEESFDISQKNTCVNIVEFRGENHFTVHLVNCISHLDPQTAASESWQGE